MEKFNPNDIGVANGNYFALPYTVEESEILLLSVPWDVTTSYMAGTSDGPEAILNASVQVDLFDADIPNAWEAPIGTILPDKTITKLGKNTRKIAENVIEELATGSAGKQTLKMIQAVNDASAELNEYVYYISKKVLEKNKLVGVVGGEHSVPLGLIKALGEKYPQFGILHVDAHADLREAYEGFTYSHASILYNVLKEVPQVTNLTQVAVRDFCSDEYEIMQNDVRVNTFTDKNLSAAQYNSESWNSLCDRILDTLPENIYISFDIDGLEPSVCPNTGTPVPGGLTYQQGMYLLEKCSKKNKNIIGFDLCEVAGTPDTESIDANVGARVLYKLCLLSWQGLKK